MDDQQNASAHKPRAWTTPVIRNVVPVDRTRGGTGDISDQDDLFYNLS